jgi:hypothetical protein
MMTIEKFEEIISWKESGIIKTLEGRLIAGDLSIVID